MHRLTVDWMALQLLMVRLIVQPQLVWVEIAEWPHSHVWQGVLTVGWEVSYPLLPSPHGLPPQGSAQPGGVRAPRR